MLEEHKLKEQGRRSPGSGQWVIEYNILETDKSTAQDVADGDLSVK